MKYFSVEELTRSKIAAKYGIDNTPSLQARQRLSDLIDRLLDPVREVWGKPIVVNSGYRCPELNRHKEIKGSPTSQHMSGEAVDITTGRREDNRRLFDLIRGGDFDFDQLIWEKGSPEGPDWIHVSYTTQRPNRRQIKHL